MSESVHVLIEQGPKGKKCAAFCPDWPGWNRGGKTGEAAFEAFATYRSRYRPIAEIAGLADEFDSAGEPEVVQRYIGTGSTDFWGISFAPSPEELERDMTSEELERKLALLQACWTFFDDVSSSVSDELKKGPRGGGRDRDAIINHVLGHERESLAGQVGVKWPAGLIHELDARREYHNEYIAALRGHPHRETRRARPWILAHLIRHSAFHVLDHAWEMQDKDLTGKE